MENQHRKIKGYRELTAAEIDLMNRIKSKGTELLALHKEVCSHVVVQCAEASRDKDADEVERLENAQPDRWLTIAETDIQTGVMALVRAIAQPAGV